MVGGSFRARLGESNTTAELAAASRVCPWADESASEDDLASELLSDATSHHDVLGRYQDVYAGRVRDSSETLRSSSGGLTNWLVLELLRKDEVDGVIHVGPSADPLFSYRVSHTAAEVQAQRKSIYYSTSFAEALLSIRGNGKRYVFVGVPCFITAARHAAAEIPDLGQQLRFFVGLVCGHLKSQAFAELLVWQVGVPPKSCRRVDFRVKRPDRPASNYDFGARGLSRPG